MVTKKKTIGEDKTTFDESPDTGSADSVASCQVREAQCRQYRQILEFISEAYVVSDVGGIIQDANCAALALFKVSRDLFVGKSLILFVPEKDRETFNIRLGRLQISKEIGEWETDLESSEGVRFHSSVLVSMTEDSPTDVKRLHWLIRDLSGSKQAAKSLRESEERYRMIFEHSPLGILHFDQEGTVVSCNKQLLSILGATREKLIGFNMIRSVRDEGMHSAIVSALSGKIGYYEGDYLSVTGNKLTPLRVLYNRITSDEGEFLGGVGIFEDITERKQAEKARRESEERYRMIFEHSPLGILHFDQEGTVVSCNKQLLSILGATREKLIGFNMIRSVRDEGMHSAIVSALSGKIGYYEGDYLSVTGNKLTPLRVLYNRITSDEGEFLGGVGIFEDITERKQAEKARRELSRQRLEACNVMAHELRNALIKIGFVFPAINSVMSFLREQWEAELRKVFSDREDKNSILMRLGELILMGQHYLGEEKELMQLSEELLAEQVIVANLFFLPQHGKNWLDSKIKPKWHRLLAETQAWEKNKEEVLQLLKRLEEAVWIVEDEDLAKKMAHLPEDLRIQWPKLAYTEFSTANLSLLEDVVHLLEHPALKIQHKHQLRKLLTSLKALADITAIIEDRMNRMLFSLKSGDPSEID